MQITKRDNIAPDVPRVLWQHVLCGAALTLLVHLVLIGVAALITRQEAKCGMLLASVVITGEVATYSLVAGWMQQPARVRVARWFWTVLAVGMVEAPIALCVHRWAGLGIFLLNFLLAAYGLALSFVSVKKLR